MRETCCPNKMGITLNFKHGIFPRLNDEPRHFITCSEIIFKFTEIIKTLREEPVSHIAKSVHADNQALRIIPEREMLSFGKIKP